MSNVNITEVRLLRVPLENDYKHTIFFASEQDQETAFKARTVKTYTDFSYQRKDGFIRVPSHFDEIMTCNYVMYKNAAYSNKWFYAFITNMEYKDDGRTDVYIETDVIQTWLKKYTVNPSFIEREHVNSDNLGEHTVPEQLETGDYIINHKIKYLQPTYKGFVIASTIDIAGGVISNIDPFEGDKFGNAVGGMYNGLYSGLNYYYEATPSGLNTVLSKIAKAGQSDAVISIFAVPAQFIEAADHVISAGSMDPKSRKWSDAMLGVDQEYINKPETINGYTPRNNKLFSYPYAYLLMSNNSGAASVYKYELFNKKLCDFKAEYALCPGGSMKLIPLDYNGAEENHEEALIGGKYPICNWTSDVYTNWLTQNSINIPISLASSAITTIGGIASMATGAGALMGASAGIAGVQGIAGTLGEIYQHSLQPPQAQGNVTAGDVTFSSGELTFTAYKMSVKAEYAKIIDEFFDMYGYKIHRVKKPNVSHRESYWYTKTIDADINGEIPIKDLQKIKECYNSGITFWKSFDNVGNYSVSNSIITGG